MKKTLFFYICFFIFFCLVSCSSNNYELSSLQEEYNRLKNEYNELKNLYQTCKDDSDSYISTMEEEYEIFLYNKDLKIKYYEDMCKKLHLLNYDEAILKPMYYYVETATGIRHKDYYCSATNPSLFKIQDLSGSIGGGYLDFDSSSDNSNVSKNRDPLSCPTCVNTSVCLLDPSAKKYHDKYSEIPFTKDYKTVSFPYMYTTDKKAKELGYIQCQDSCCNDAE